METIDSRIAALARLDKTPEQVLAHERAELEEQIRVLQQKTRFERYADWRYKHLELDDVDMGWLIFAFVTRMAEVGVVIWALLAKNNFWVALTVFLLFEIVRLLFTTLGERPDTWGRRVYRFFVHLSYIPLTLVMPLVILVDIKVLRIGEQDRPRKIESLQNRMERLTPHEIVPEFYAQGIEEARTELLGYSSEPRKAERRLRTYLEEVRADKILFQSRLDNAGDAVDRVDDLSAYLQRLSARESSLIEKLEGLEQTITKLHALLDACAAQVSRLPDRLMDQELKRKSESRVMGEIAAMQEADEAINHSIDLVRDRLMQIAAVVSAPQRELPSANPEGDMRTFFANLDKMAEQVATLEAQKAF